MIPLADVGDEGVDAGAYGVDTTRKRGGGGVPPKQQCVTYAHIRHMRLSNELVKSVKTPKAARDAGRLLQAGRREPLLIIIGR